ncbi:MFS transporter [Nonomuraea typhae]|uniref:MFS transporter n=1 Tax=Nonomuraea typhae TaxID=2603600 RepID=UPI0012F89AF4|nr:MFS transporter [Nonomuraea typhae]
MTVAATRTGSGTASISRAFPLALAAFAGATGDMVIAGVLPDIATDLRVGEPLAGQLVTAYAIAFGLGSLLMAVITARLPRRPVLFGGLAVFAVANVLAAVAPSYTILIVLRVVGGLAAAASTPAAMAAAAMIAPEDRRGRYLSLVTTGITAALVLGVPIGTWIGGQYGWRATMVFVAVLAVLALLGTFAVPKVAAPPWDGLRAQLAPLTQGSVVRVFVALIISGTGGLMLLTYMFPIFRTAGGVDYQAMSLLFTVHGIAGTAAAWLGGRASDRIGPHRTLLLAFSGYAVFLWATAAVTLAGGMPIAVLIAAAILLALAGWAVNPPLQSLMYMLAPGAAAQAMALATCAMFIGASLGGVLGGVLLATVGAAAIPLAGGLLVIAAAPILPRANRGKS